MESLVTDVRYLILIRFPIIAQRSKGVDYFHTVVDLVVINIDLWVGHLADVITYAKFQGDIFRGYDFTGGLISHFLLIFAWALQHCSATVLPVILRSKGHSKIKYCQ